MSDYRIVETEYGSGRIDYLVEVWVTSPTLDKDKNGIAAGFWNPVTMHTSKIEATDHIDLMRSRKLDTTVIKRTELDDKGEAKGGK